MHLASRRGSPACRRTAFRRAYYAKGNYFTLSGRSPFSRLIYPVPVPGGLGVHLTIDLGGQARFGPDVQWIDAIDYTVDPARADSFYAAVRKYWPALKDGALQPGYAGIRPKIVPRGAPAQDFVVQGPQIAWRAGADQPVRHRKPGPDRVAGAGRVCSGDCCDRLTGITKQSSGHRVSQSAHRVPQRILIWTVRPRPTTTSHAQPHQVSGACFARSAIVLLCATLCALCETLCPLDCLLRMRHVVGIRALTR